VYFKSGDLACLDYQGQIVWQKNLQDLYGEDTLWWDLGTSPVLTKDLVVVACIHSGPSYLVGLEKDSGEIAWKHDRNLDAPDEALQTYATPMPAEVNGREMLVVLGADHVTAHDTSTGDEIWRVGGLNPEQNRFFRSIASPVVDGEIVVVPYARGGSLTAIRIDGQGDVTDSHIVWSKEGREKIVSADVPTPAARDGRLYLCTDRGVVVCMDIQTGDVIWEGQVERSSAEYSASPIIADGKLYVTREDGLTSVLDLSSDEFKLLSVNNLNEFVVATPAFVDGRILIRTDKHLYCIGQ
jgi:outer membrane protein assembly factor BamB